MTATEPLTVLIVDDDDADTLMIEEALQTASVVPHIYRVSDGQEALDFLHQDGEYLDAPRPDLVLLDLNMPKVSGHEVLAVVKNDPDLKAIPIVVLTTSEAAADIAASYGQHANAFVTKPMDYESFEAVVGVINRFYSEVARLPK